jgi:hypothetical protein
MRRRDCRVHPLIRNAETYNRRSVLQVQPQAEDRYWSAVAVVSRVVDELIAAVKWAKLNTATR